MKESQELNESVKQLNSLLRSRLSFWRNFLIGLVAGIGSAIGAAIIGSILVGVLVANLDEIPIIRDIIPTQKVQEFLEE